MRQIRSLVLVLSLLIAAGSTAVGANDPPPAQIDAVFADYDTTVSPGCALGVIRDGVLVYKRGYGMANLEHGIALSPRSVFRTGSVGKQFTAMAVALLADKGVLSLDDSVRMFLPEMPAYADAITIRHLVHHTSGLRDYLELAWLAGLDDEEHYTAEYALELIARQRFTNFAPGGEYLYSNSGYFLLSYVVQRATGMSLREWAEENIFGPLGMTDTHYHDDHTHIVPNRADGYAPSEGGYRISMTTLDMVGDGGVFTTVEDLLFWDRNFYDNRLGTGGPELIDRIATPGRLDNGEEIDYAFGLEIASHRGLRLVSHGGGYVGYRAEMARFPDQRLSVAVLCNRADAEAEQLAITIAELYLADEMEAEQSPAGLAARGSDTRSLTDSEARPWIGHYWQKNTSSVREIRLQDGKLFYVRSDEDQSELAPVSEERFVMVDAAKPVAVWFESTGRTRTRMLEQVGEQEPSISTQFRKRVLTEADLAAHAGTYYSEELDVEYEITHHNGSLFFGSGKPGDRLLEPQFGETFTNSDYGAFTFQRDSRSQIIGFSLDCERVRNLAFVRR